MKVYSSLICLLLLFSSCLPYVINHDVIYAPKVFLSPDVDTLLIINNTGYQRQRDGHKYIFHDKGGILLQRTDTFNNEFLAELSKSFRKMGVITLLEERAVRSDSDYLEVRPLDSVIVDSLYRKHHADFALVLDKGAVSGDLVVSKLKDTTALYFNYALSYFTDIHMHNMQQNINLTNVSSKTGTSWEALNASFTNGVNSLAFDDVMRKNEIGKMTDQIMRSFFPYGITHERCVFYNSNMNMKDAVRYVKKNKWDEASIIWSYIFENSQNATNKLYSALNLAHHFERMDMLSQTYYWLKIAEGLSDNMKIGEDNYISEYLTSVEKRLNTPKPQVIGYY